VAPRTPVARFHVVQTPRELIKSYHGRKRYIFLPKREESPMRVDHAGVPPRETPRTRREADQSDLDKSNTVRDVRV